MSEKRFTLTTWHEVKGNGKIMTVDEVVGKLNEQQATISQLQDLCGESDGENAKLRIENKKLKEENEQLKKKNKALKEDINQSEKRVKHWMMLYGDVYDKMQKRRVSG